jgi:hypothetical protein
VIYLGVWLIAAALRVAVGWFMGTKYLHIEAVGSIYDVEIGHGEGREEAGKRVYTHSCAEYCVDMDEETGRKREIKAGEERC